MCALAPGSFLQGRGAEEDFALHRVVEVVVETPAFFAEEGAIDDERRHGDKIAEFQEVGRDFEVPVKLLHFRGEVA